VSICLQFRKEGIILGMKKESQNSRLNKSEQTRTNYRTWKSGKSWLYAASVLATLAGGMGLANSARQVTSHDAIKANAATTDSGQLAYGSIHDTGNHVYTSADMPNINNWVTVHQGAGVGLGGPDGTWGTMISVTNGANSNGQFTISVFKNAIDMAQPALLQAPMYFSQNNGTGNQLMFQGDGSGFIFTPASNATLQAQVTKPLGTTAGQNLGIGGLANTYWMGRDMYANGKFDNVSANGTDKQQTMSIRSTDASGTLVNGTQAGFTMWPQTTAPASAYISGKNYSSNEIYLATWTPASPGTINADGTVTGHFTFQVSKDPSVANAGSTTTTTLTGPTINVARMQSMGVSASGGASWNYTSFGYQAPGNSLQGSKATAPVKVQYISTRTGQPIPGSTPSTITANVGDLIGQNNTAGTGNAADDYTYTAPTIPGYTYSAQNTDSQSNNSQVSVAIDGSSVMDVYYDEVPDTANFIYNYDETTAHAATDPTLPTTITESDFTGNAIAQPTLPALASGYYVSKILAPNGYTYTLNVTTNEAPVHNGTQSGTITVTDASGAVVRTVPVTTAFYVQAEDQALLNEAMVDNGVYTPSVDDFKLIVSKVSQGDITIDIVGPNGTILAPTTTSGDDGSQYSYAISTTITDSNGFIWNAVVTYVDANGNIIYVDGSASAAGQNPNWIFVGNEHLQVHVTYVMSNDSVSDSDSDSVSDSDHASDSDSDHASDSDSDHASDSDSDSDSISDSDSDSDSISDSDSDSDSISDSDSDSDSISDSDSDSDSISDSDSDSDSISDSDSDSDSISDSDSDSDSISDSDSDSDSISDSDSDSDSISDSDSDSDSISDSDSDSDSISDSDSDSDSISDSDSDSDSISDSDSDSDSISDSDSDSDSISDSDSDSDSISDSDSDSDSISDSDSDSDSISDSDSDSDSISDSDSDSDSISDSDSDSDSISDSDSDSDSISDSDSDSDSISDSDSDSDSISDSDSDSISDSDSDSDSISDSDSDSISDSDSDSDSISDSDSDSDSDSESDLHLDHGENDGGGQKLPDTGDNSSDAEALLAGLGLIGLAGLSKRKKRKDEDTTQA